MAETKQLPSTLMAILYAARKSGDCDLERYATRELKDQFGIEVKFRDAQSKDKSNDRDGNR